MSARNTTASVCALVAAIVVLLAFGVFGVARSSGSFAEIDLPFFQTAGKMWLNGQNPYDLAEFEAALGQTGTGGFAYPPMAAPFFMFLGLFSVDAGRVALTMLSVVAAIAIAVIAGRWQPQPPGVNPASPARSLCMAAMIALPAATHILWLGQVTLVVGAALVGAWALIHQRREVLGGVLLGLASIKPQFALLPCVWLLLDRRWKPLFVAGVTGLVLVAYPALQRGVVTLSTDWLENLRTYKEIAANTPGSRFVLGARSVVSATGVETRPLFWLCIGGTAVACLRVYRDRIRFQDALPALMAIYLLFGDAHGPDMVLLAPIVASLWFWFRGRPVYLLVGWGLWASLWFPFRVLDRYGLGLLAHWPTFAILVAAGLMIALAINDRGDDPETAETA